jgi:uncharacterized protein YcbK (DUF882 family)
MRKEYFIYPVILIITSAFALYLYDGQESSPEIEDVITPPVNVNEKINVELIKNNLTEKEEKVFGNRDISDYANETEVTRLFEIAPYLNKNWNDFEYKDLELYNVNTKEKLDIVFWVNGNYIPKALDRLDQFMRDWRQNQAIDIDPELYVLLHRLYENVDAEAPIHLTSGYRSEATNNWLRKLGVKTARKSHHVQGKAADITIPGVPAKEIKQEAVELEKGGVGYYPKKNFVHVDTGRVRQW